MNQKLITSINILKSYGFIDIVKGGKAAFLGEVREFEDGFHKKIGEGIWQKLPDKQTSNSTELTEEDKQNIYSYTSTTYHKINGNYRKGNITDEAIQLKDALLKLPKHVGESIRYESNYRDDLESYLNDFKPGANYQFNQFLSTTTSQTVLNTLGDRPIRFEIKGKNGRNIEQYSDNKSEKEILFLPESVFKIKSVKVIKYKNGFLKGKIQNIIIKLEEI